MKPIFKCKCNDCEEELTEQNTDKSERDICNICWENRGWVVSHAGIIGMVKFREIQAAMRGRSHKAKVLIEAQKIILADND